MPFAEQGKSVSGYAGVDVTLHKNLHLIPNVELTAYDEATDGTTPGTDVVPRVTLFYSW